MKFQFDLVRHGGRPGNIFTLPLTVWSDRPEVLVITPIESPPVMLWLKPNNGLQLSFTDMDGDLAEFNLPVLACDERDLADTRPNLAEATELLKRALGYVQHSEEETTEQIAGWEKYYESRGKTLEEVEGPRDVVDPPLSDVIERFLRFVDEKYGVPTDDE